MLHALPAIPYDTDEIVPAVVTPHARIKVDGNRYSQHQAWHAGPSAFAPIVTKFAFCTRGGWRLSMSARTNEDN